MGALVKTFVCGLVAVFVGVVKVAAQTPAPDPRAGMPERPSVATHAGTVAAGFVEIEAGVEIDRYDDASNGGLVPAVVKIGLASHLQLTVQTPLVRPSGAGTGVGDVSVGIKWRVVDDTPLFGDLAALPAVKFPSGSATTGTGTGTTDVGLLLISSKQWGEISLDLNVGFTRRSGDGGNAPRNASLWAASLGGPVAGRVGWGAEVYGYPATSGPAGSEAIVAVLLGPTFDLRNSLVLDLGLIAPLSGPQPRAVFAGFTYNVGLTKR